MFRFVVLAKFIILHKSHEGSGSSKIHKQFTVKHVNAPVSIDNTRQ